MTSYWPTSAITQHLAPTQQAEIADARRGICIHTIAACHAVTSKIPACGSLAFVCSEGVGMRRVYLNYPSFEQWTALERGGFVEMWDDFGFVMDALH
jgi:hypothetical protein